MIKYDTWTTINFFLNAPNLSKMACVRPCRSYTFFFFFFGNRLLNGDDLF